MEPLSDPYNDRVIKTVAIPPSRPLTTKLMYPDQCNPPSLFIYSKAKPDVPDYQAVRKHLVAQGTIGRAELVKLIKDVTQAFSI